MISSPSFTCFVPCREVFGGPTLQRIDVNVKHETVNRDAEAVAYLRKLKALGVSREKLEEELGFSDHVGLMGRWRFEGERLADDPWPETFDMIVTWTCEPTT